MLSDEPETLLHELADTVARTVDPLRTCRYPEVRAFAADLVVNDDGIVMVVQLPQLSIEPRRLSSR